MKYGLPDCIIIKYYCLFTNLVAAFAAPADPDPGLGGCHLQGGSEGHRRHLVPVECETVVQGAPAQHIQTNVIQIKKSLLSHIKSIVYIIVILF